MPSPPPQSSPSGQGAVDRLTTFFLGKFQETRKTSELAALQCATQLKFEAAEKQLVDHATTIAGLRSEVQSFWDKAPSFFLHKFSAQLDSLSAARSEKGEQALSRLEHKVDDEVRNLGDQVAGLSTKLAVGTASTSASVDDLARRVDSERDSAAESLRRCENDFRSRMTRLESVIETNKTEAAIEYDKLNKTSQEAGRRLQSKIDSLELTVMRQSEELTGQCSKMERMEKELQRLLQMSLHQERTYAGMSQMLSAQRDELAKLREQAARSRTPIRQSPRIHSSRGDMASTHWQQVGASSLSRWPGSQAQGTTSFSEPSQMDSRKRAHESAEQTSAPEVKPPPHTAPEPPAKRPRRRSNALPQTGENNGKPARALRAPPPQNSPTLLRKVPTTSSAALENRMSTSRARKSPQKVVEEESRLACEDGTPDEGEDEASDGENPARRNSPKTRAARLSAKQRTKPIVPEKETEAVTTKTATKTATKSAARPPEKQSTASTKSAATKTTSEVADAALPARKDDSTDPAAERREKTLAFMRHVRAFAVEFKCTPPRSERQFIWQFIEGIPDADWSTFFQKKLLAMFPSAVRPSLGVRAKHAINFDAGLTWRHVLEVIRSLQPGS